MKKTVLILLTIILLMPVVKIYGQDQSIHKKSRASINNDKLSLIKNRVESNNFAFKARQALPMAGPVINLTSSYELNISPKTIIAFLPYFGRAYSAPYGSDDNGIKFKSVKFQYLITSRKKGGWDIRIKPLDTRKRYELYLTITTTGYASLSVNDETRQSISFNGIIDASDKE